MSVLDVVIRVILAAVLGGAIGIEREIREHTAGFRTHILVSVGAAAFTIASAHGLNGTNFDPNRISAQIVTGIGFLGAGAILRYGVSVRGLTTAAGLWTVAAVGLAAGKGFYSLALVTTALVLFSLYLLRLIERRFLYKLVGAPIAVRIHFPSHGFTALTQTLTALERAHVAVKELSVRPEEAEDNTVHLLLRLPRGVSRADIIRLLTQIDDAQVVSFE